MQAPAREALELIGPSRKPSPSAPAPHRTPARRPPPRRPLRATRAPRITHARSLTPAAAPRTDVPPVAPELPNNTDVCALGRKYGGWKADSPEAVICKRSWALTTAGVRRI